VDHKTPYKIEGLGVTRQIALGEGHACALGADAKMRCWGNNSDGQLGRPPSEVLQTAAPLETPGMDDVRSIGLGYRFSCAVKNDGRLFCWGNNQYGTVGNGTKTNQSSPFQVVFPNKMLEVAGGFSNTCAVEDVTRAVYCWGYNGKGTVGAGSSAPEYILLPQRVAITSVKKLLVKEMHVCALTDANNALCWGNNYSGELSYDNKLDQFPNPGTSNKDDNIIPMPVLLNAGQVLDAAVGHNFTCFLMAGGGARCVGSNNGADGTLGNGWNLIETYQSVRVYNIRGGMAKLYAGPAATYAMTPSGSLYCWGMCYRGDGSVRKEQPTPIHFVGFTGGPSLGSNFTEGQDGSVFSVSAQGFGEDLDIGLTINSHVLSKDFKVKTNAEGQCTFDVDFGVAADQLGAAAARPDGTYTLTVEAGGQSASTQIRLAARAPKQAAETPAAAVVFGVPGWLMPVVDRLSYFPLVP
jgi:hypothetical protein